MTLTDAILLGFIQGFSEFLPISSSAHLVIAQALLHVSEPSIFLEVALHLGTLLSVFIYYWRDVIGLIRSFLAYLLPADRALHREQFLEVLYIIIGTLPAAVGGLLFKDYFERSFEDAWMSGVELMITGVILIATRWAPDRERPMNWWIALIVGFAQLWAIMPGISRSGTTIAAALFLGVDPRRAARFSFLLSLPSVAGAVLLKALDLRDAALPSADLDLLGIGAVISFIVGIVSIWWLLKLMMQKQFFAFGFYCLIVGFLTTLFIK